MRVSLEEWRLSFFWLEAETNLCAQGSGLCGAAGGQGVAFLPLGARGLSQGDASSGSASAVPRGGFHSWLLLLAPLWPLRCGN